MKIPLSRPDITQREIKEVIGVLKTPYLSLGPKQAEFQKKFAAYIGTKYAEVVSSGTAGLHILMKSFGIGKGDEVITTPYSFIASANCILFTQASPVFVDIDVQTFNIDAEKIEEKITSRTKAILVVHVFGMPADMPKINRIAKKHGLIVIEDACEALGAGINGKKVGTFSDAAVFAFYPNKQITTGEGGMVVTNKKSIADNCRSLKNQGRGPQGSFVQLGYNYRLSDINCALGVAQLARINSSLKKRKEVAQAYKEQLKNFQGLKLLCERKGYERSWFVYVIKLSDQFKRNHKFKMLRLLAKKGIECGDYFSAIHLTPFYQKMFGFKRGDFPIAEKIADRTLALPFHNNLKKKEIIRVCRELVKFLS
ncbi:MAG: DegT/DnrJ/EryC1/StrS family aminotransferase [Candidatus Omnitrophica bacterium]|nr:DegT/DnrJ/EryC1/StrS family aminotransferase [Candidatus Omnitrophota bacterium]